ncbi:MAG: hypothetical protein EAZ97_02185 [Bacteroidetes bacterium]|nr:MAG: hypothetical protein EAZ97_02185 [Bacteroidota bacterium]
MTYPINRFYEFSVSAIIWHELTHKLKFTELQNLLCDHLKLTNYTTEVKKYFFVYVAMFLEYEKPKHFTKKKAILRHTLVLDYQKFAIASEKEALQMQAELYLQGIKEIPKIRGMKKIAFDYEKFYTDAKLLFQKQGWISL